MNVNPETLLLGVIFAIGFAVVIHDELEIRKLYKNIIDTCKKEGK